VDRHDITARVFRQRLKSLMDMPFQFQILQFPIRLAFAITINKTQGQPLELCGLHLHTDCFSHGQLYVACSRVGKPDNLDICTDNGTTKNIVYPQALWNYTY
jgi:ATP-dependent DNA helicase PIF1